MFENMFPLVNRAPGTWIWADLLNVRSGMNLSVILLRREMGGESVSSLGQERRLGITDTTSCNCHPGF